MQPILQQCHPDNLGFVIDLAAKWTDEIGFLPRAALEYYAANSGVLRVLENAEDAGFVVFNRSVKEAPRVARIYQAAICYDAQRRHLGTALVNRVKYEAAMAGAAGLYLWCASDIAAAEFWSAMGFWPQAVKRGGKRRGRHLTLWATAGCEHNEDFQRIKASVIAPERGQMQLFDCQVEYR